MSEQPTTSGYGDTESAPLESSEFSHDLFNGAEGDEPTSHLDAEGPTDELSETPEGEPSTESPAAEPPHNPIFPVLVGGVLLAVMVVGAILNLEQAKPSVAATTPSSAPETAKEPADPTKALATSVDGLKSEVTALSKQIKELQGHLEATSKNEIHPLQTKIEALTRSTEGLSSLPAKVTALDNRLNGVDGRVAGVDKALSGGIGSVRQDLVALKSEVRRVGQTAEQAAQLAASKPTAGSTPSSTAAAAEPAVVDEEKAVARLASLYKSGKYKEAADAFHNDRASSDSKDARFWYYAAVSQGSATNDWKGEAEQLVKKGVEREKAGTPNASEIDAEMAALPAGVKLWLDYYRKDAK